jgi:hypothetical protein
LVVQLASLLWPSSCRLSNLFRNCHDEINTTDNVVGGHA